MLESGGKESYENLGSMLAWQMRCLECLVVRESLRGIETTLEESTNIYTRVKGSHKDSKELTLCVILRVFSDCLYCLFSVWWLLKEVQIMVRDRVRVLEPDTWMIRCKSSFHLRLLTKFWSRLM